MGVANRIHITGASGSGTTALGAAIADRYGYTHLDVDSYFWEPTDPPFTRMREPSERLRLLTPALDAHRRWVLTGSLTVWGDVLIPRFDLVVFLYVPHEIRMARIMDREVRRYGREAIAPGGPMYEQHRAFIHWAEQYDTADETMRSLRIHNRWLTELPCECIRIEGPLTIEERLARLADYVGVSLSRT